MVLNHCWLQQEKASEKAQLDQVLSSPAFNSEDGRIEMSKDGREKNCGKSQVHSVDVNPGHIC